MVTSLFESTAHRFVDTPLEQDQCQFFWGLVHTIDAQKRRLERIVDDNIQEQRTLRDQGRTVASGKQILNVRVKGREPWRPYGASVLADQAC